MPQATPGQAANRPARLVDVARAAGVHASTASRVINGTGTLSIPAATRERILDTARRLHYRPNAIARGLRTASAGAIGLLAPSLRGPGLTSIIRGAFDRASERGYVVLLVEDAEDAGATSAYHRLTREGRVDGVLIASARPAPPADGVAVEIVPSVFVGRRGPGLGCKVSMREEDAGALAAGHLLSLGHRRLAHLAGPDESDPLRALHAGFLSAATAAGAEVLTEHAALQERAGFEAMSRLLAASPGPSAVFVSNIAQAVGALAGARRAGCRVPSDVAIVAGDDDPVAEFLEPPLTVITMPLYELGTAAVDALIDQLEGGEPGDVVIRTPPRLVLRASTAPPGADSGAVAFPPAGRFVRSRRLARTEAGPASGPGGSATPFKPPPRPV
jgi:LacI family transcriptional regulator